MVIMADILFSFPFMSASSILALSKNLAFGYRCVNCVANGHKVFSIFLKKCSPRRVFLFANILIKVLELVFMDENGPCHFQCKGVL